MENTVSAPTKDRYNDPKTRRATYYSDKLHEDMSELAALDRRTLSNWMEMQLIEAVVRQQEQLGIVKE